MFFGNLVRRICILPDLNVSHKPSPEEDEEEFGDGDQRSDIDHLRWMVAVVVRTVFPYTYRTKISYHFRLFFYEIFTLKGLKDYFVS